jgi:hypothetical protein
MFKKLLPLIVVLALLVAYAGYRAVDAKSGLSAGSKLSTPSGQSAAGEQLTKPIVPDTGSSQEITDDANSSSGNASGAASYVGTHQTNLDTSDCNMLKARRPVSSSALRAIC